MTLIFVTQPPNIYFNVKKSTDSLDAKMFIVYEKHKLPVAENVMFLLSTF